jgi:alpha-glucosidase
MLHATRRLVAFRKAHPALMLGEMTLLDRNDDLLAFERVFDGERLVCVFNLGQEPIAWTRPEGHQVIEAVNLDASQAGVLPPMAGLVLATG